MKIGHRIINFEQTKLTEEEALTLQAVTSGVFKSLQGIKNADYWHFCRKSLENQFAQWVGINQADHPFCSEARSILFKMHDWDPAEWRRYAGLTEHHEGLHQLWMMPCDELHKAMMSVLNKKALGLDT